MGNDKTSVGVFSEPTSSLTHVLLVTGYPKRKIEIVPKGVALRLCRVCNTDEEYKRLGGYQKYLMARDYQPVFVKKQFDDVRNLSRLEV